MKTHIKNPDDSVASYVELCHGSGFQDEWKEDMKTGDFVSIGYPWTFRIEAGVVRKRYVHISYNGENLFTYATNDPVCMCRQYLEGFRDGFECLMQRQAEPETEE